jgi:deoxyadenosine kinase
LLSKTRQRPFIGIAGTMGAGKSTLARELGVALSLPVYQEPISPYLGDFYKDPSAWSFHMQAYMIGARSSHAQALGRGGGIQDRTVYEDHIFAEMLRALGDMTARDFSTYDQLRRAVLPVTPEPDLILYLSVSPETSIERVKARARGEEEAVPDAYLRSLCGRYEDWAQTTDRELLRLDWDRPAKLEGVLSQIYDQIGGRYAP